MASNKASKAFMLLGQCMPSLKVNASKIQVRRMKLDTYLNMVNNERNLILRNFPDGSRFFFLVFP
jgi:hypothetical protein